MSSLVLLRVPIREEPRTLVRARAKGRARFVGAMLSLALAAIAVRGAWLCVAPVERVVEAGAMQRYEQVVLRASRGEILDRNGRRLATSVDTPTVAVDPAMIAAEDRDELAAEVAGILGLPKDEIVEKMSRESRYAKLATRVHPKIAAEIARIDHPALWTHADPHRYYPEETLASQVVGFVDSSGTGRAGLEEALDDKLRGGSLVVQRRRDRKGLDVDRPGGVGTSSNVGMDVHTTLDRHVQHIAERALAGVMETSAPVSASALVVDVKTGDILAIANSPRFNPNAVGQEAEPRKNHIVVDAIEPGSIFKPFTIAAAVEEGLVTPESLIDCEGGTYFIGRSRIRDDHPHGVITVAEVMKFSSNIGVAKLAFKMGASTFIDYLHDFGFGQKTGIELPGERQGRIRDPEKIRPIELATTAFGQGTTATPLQLAMGIAAIGNGGVRMQPRLVTRVEDAHGVPDFVMRPTVAGRAVSAETARQTAEMMALVTEQGGTGTRARVPGYRVAGKTGTAQKVKDGHYSEARISSFVGFVPVDDPVIAVVVVVDEPTIGSRYGGIAAGPAWSEIAGQTLRYLGVRPDPALLAEQGELPVAAAEPKPERARTPVELAWAGDAWTLPDLRGRSMRDVLVGLQGAGLRVEVLGSGLAVAQQPMPGQRVSPGGSVAVTFQ